MAYRLSEHAERDLDDIWEYVFDDSASEERARKVIVRLLETISLIAGNPRIGRLRPDLRLGVRSLAADKYLAIYNTAAEDVQILRVVHGSRNLDLLQVG